VGVAVPPEELPHPMSRTSTTGRKFFMARECAGRPVFVNDWSAFQERCLKPRGHPSEVFRLDG
jgi:hypothetical protein